MASNTKADLRAYGTVGALMTVGFFLPWFSLGMGEVSGADLSRHLRQMSSAVEMLGGDRDVGQIGKIASYVMWLIPISGGAAAFYAFNGKKSQARACSMLASFVMIGVLMILGALASKFGEAGAKMAVGTMEIGFIVSGLSALGTWFFVFGDILFGTGRALVRLVAKMAGIRKEDAAVPVSPRPVNTEIKVTKQPLVSPELKAALMNRAMVHYERRHQYVGAMKGLLTKEKLPFVAGGIVLVSLAVSVKFTLVVVGIGLLCFALKSNTQASQPSEPTVMVVSDAAIEASRAPSSDHTQAAHDENDPPSANVQ